MHGYTFMWRINYGQGQVDAVASKKAGVAALRLCDGYAYLQRYETGTADDPGMWVTVVRARDLQPEGGRS